MRPGNNPEGRPGRPEGRAGPDTHLGETVFGCRRALERRRPPHRAGPVAPGGAAVTRRSERSAAGGASGAPLIKRHAGSRDGAHRARGLRGRGHSSRVDVESAAVPEGLVRTRFVVVADVLDDDAPEVILTEAEDAVEHLSPECADAALSEGIHVRGAY